MRFDEIFDLTAVAYHKLSAEGTNHNIDENKNAVSSGQLDADGWEKQFHAKHTHQNFHLHVHDPIHQRDATEVVVMVMRNYMRTISEYFVFGVEPALREIVRGELFSSLTAYVAGRLGGLVVTLEYFY